MKKLNIFFTSDNHFYHKNIMKYENRPFDSIEDMNETMIKNWNSTVGPKDHIYILGDLTFSNKENTKKLLDSLNGKKYLIIGNHDKVGEEIKKYFVWVDNLRQIKIDDQKIILCHYPIYSWNGKFHGSWHFHGHTHTVSHEDFTHEKKVNVGVDLWDYAPVSFERIIGEEK